MRPPPSERRKREITDKIVELVALDVRPVNIVEGKGFKELKRTLEPGYTIPKRDGCACGECKIHTHKGRDLQINKDM